MYCTYFDHVQRACYDPVLVTENWDHGAVFFGDTEEMMDLPHVSTINLGKRINSPADIPAVQNMCVNYCFDVLNADWVVYAMGDMYVTKAGHEWLQSFLSSQVPDVWTVPVMGLCLYNYMWEHPFTITLSHRDRRIEYDLTGDGEACNVWHPIPVDTRRLFMDVGYIGTPQYYGKMDNHRHIWKDGDAWKPRFLYLWEKDRALAVREAYKHIVKSAGKSIEMIDANVYWELIERMGLVDDYKFCSDQVKYV